MRSYPGYLHDARPGVNVMLSLLSIEYVSIPNVTQLGDETIPFTRDGHPSARLQSCSRKPLPSLFSLLARLARSNSHVDLVAALVAATVITATASQLALRTEHEWHIISGSERCSRRLQLHQLLC